MIWPWKKERTAPAEAYDRAALEPVIRSSICTGEKVAGFREKEGGRFREVALIRTPTDLEALGAPQRTFRRDHGFAVVPHYFS